MPIPSSQDQSNQVRLSQHGQVGNARHLQPMEQADNTLSGFLHFYTHTKELTTCYRPNFTKHSFYSIFHHLRPARVLAKLTDREADE